MVYKLILFFVIATFVLSSCKTNESENENLNPVARVSNDYLYTEDIYIPESIEDTNSYVNEFSDNWIQDKLIYNEAIKNLPNQTKYEYNKLVEDYKNQLFLNAYKELYIKQKLDTNVSNSEILEYYKKNIGEYKLTDNIVKAIYIKIPVKAPKVYKVRNWLKSNKPEDLEKLNTYCTQYSNKFDDFQGDWILFNDVLQFFPKKISNQNSVLKYKHLLETRDSSFYYYIDVDDYKLAQDTTPVIFVKNEIIDDIIKIRKRELINRMKQDLYDDAKNKKEIEFFNKK